MLLYQWCYVRENSIITILYKYKNININIKNITKNKILLLILFSFLNKIEEILQYICLVEVVGCTFILCLLGYYIIMVHEKIISLI